MLRLSKQANEEIKRVKDQGAEHIASEREKRRESEHIDDKQFWEATARHWHRRAATLETSLRCEQNTIALVAQDLEAQKVEIGHWKRAAEENHADVMAAERRTDALGDILDALKGGYQIDAFPGRATWWRLDTDTLAEIARDAREWQDQQSEKITTLDGIGQPIVVDLAHLSDPEKAEFLAKIKEHNGGGRFVKPATDPAAGALDPAAEHDLREQMIAKIARAYSMGMPMPVTPLHQAPLFDLMREFELATRFICETEARIERERLAQTERTATVEPTKAEVEAEELIGIANHIHSAIDGFPAEFQPWASEIHDRIRQVAHRLNQK